MNKVMRILKEKKIIIVNQVLELDCNIYISVRLKDAHAVFEIFKNQFEIKIEEV